MTLKTIFFFISIAKILCYKKAPIVMNIILLVLPNIGHTRSLAALVLCVELRWLKAIKIISP